jgi:hypothetical protein
VQVSLAKAVDERGGDARGAPRLRHHLAEHCAQADHDGDEPERSADAVLERLHCCSGIPAAIPVAIETDTSTMNVQLGSAR